MARLATHHDRFHVHKAAGFACLFHFVAVYMCLLAPGLFGRMHVTTAAAATHAFLSVSAFAFPLPAKRSDTLPVIWREFRAHSVVFAVRHVVAVVACRAGAWSLDPATLAAQKAALLIATMVAADAATCWLGGSRDRRTTNGMPYPLCVREEERRRVRAEYARCQFGATCLATLPDERLAFLPLLGIQIAPFLMTLVRKGRADVLSYHSVYAACLWLPWACMVIHFAGDPPSGAQQLFAAFAAPHGLRTRLGFGKHTCWCLYCVLVFAAYPSAPFLAVWEGAYDHRLAAALMAAQAARSAAAFLPLWRKEWLRRTTSNLYLLRMLAIPERVATAGEPPRRCAPRFGNTSEESTFRPVDTTYSGHYRSH
jgi:hypothetical protein